MGIRIIGVGGYVPSRAVSNEELARRVDTSHDWIVSHTGICERRFAEPDEAPSDMGGAAARCCLSDAGVEASAVDLIVVACATLDQSQPAVACMIQDKLGIAERHCPAFDVNSVCAGFVFALNVAQSMMIANPGQYRHALVVGTDVFSKILDWGDRRTCIFFGDGAGAVLLAQTGLDERRMHFALGSDGRGCHYIEVPAGGTRQRVDADVLDKRLNKFFMQGAKVWEFAMEIVPRVIRGLLAEHRLSPAAVDLLVLHQSNLRMIEAIMRSLEMPPERRSAPSPQLRCTGTRRRRASRSRCRRRQSRGGSAAALAWCFAVSAAGSPGARR